MRRVAVLGASGYLGGLIAAELDGRTGCLVLRRRGASELGGDEMRPGDVVVNCVGRTGTLADELRNANVDHALEVAELCRANDLGLVHISSSAVFDAIPSGRIVEETPPSARSAYGRSKALGEQLVRRVLPTARVLRPAKVFGGDDPRRRLAALSRYVRRGMPLPVPRRPALWANFVWAHPLASLVADDALGAPMPAGIAHLATPCDWATFVDMLGAALGRPVRRAPLAAEAAAGLAARAAWRSPRLRRLTSSQRLLEIWDRVEFVDSSERLSAGSLRAGLEELASKPA